MKILVLAGGADQIALIKELKWRGHITILIDYFQNPPAKNYANKHIVASTLDIEMICPLHGPILKDNLGYYLNKYQIWSSYQSRLV